jgi:hypothetical protein
MKNQLTPTFAAIVVLGCVVLGYVVTGYAAIQSTSAVSTTESSASTATAWEYARLIIDQDENATWHAGVMNRNPQTFSIDVQYSRLGGSSRANVVNLLNEIGNDGWELVTTDDATYTFKRRK